MDAPRTPGRPRRRVARPGDELRSSGHDRFVPPAPDQIERDLHERAARRHGIVTRVDAIALGLTAKQIDHRLARGRWARIHPGVYRIAGCPETELQTLAAATLWTGGAASHLSAGSLHGLIAEPGRPQVTVRRSTSGRRPGVTVHRLADLDSGDLTRREGILCTNPTRTCIDLGACMSEARLERVIDRALHHGLTHIDRLALRLLQLGRSGRPGTVRVRSVLRRLDPGLAPSESELESLLIQVLRRHGLPDPVRQHRVEVGGRRFRLDLCYPERRIALESDGFAHHGHREAFEHDRVRQNLLVLAGWRVLRFTWRQICADPTDVANQVRNALAH